MCNGNSTQGQGVNDETFLVDVLLELDASRKCEDTLLQRAPKNEQTIIDLLVIYEIIFHQGE